MSKFLIRLDDASEYMDLDKWNRIISILDDRKITPIIGVIPDNKDQSIVSKYEFNNCFWDLVRNWDKKGYCIAVHGYNHVFTTKSGGINPVNKYSEFAEVSLIEQEEMIKKAIAIFHQNEIKPKIFFAPAHTFDLNTLTAIKKNTDIRIISDMIASKQFYYEDMYFIPQQIGLVRKPPLPMGLVTFCYHPNNMEDKTFAELEAFLNKNHSKFINANDLILRKRKINLYDRLLRYLYFKRR